MVGKDISDAKSRIGALLEDLDGLEYNDRNALDAFKRRGEMILRNIYGDGHRNVARFVSINFGVGMVFWKKGAYERAWAEGENRIRNLLNSLIEELEEFGLPEVEKPASSALVMSDDAKEDLTYRQQRALTRERALIGAGGFVVGALITGILSNIDKIQEAFSPDPTATTIPITMLTIDSATTNELTESSVLSHDPHEQAVFDYYGLVNAGKYGDAWDRLSPKFQLNSNNNDYDVYADWWRNQGEVTVQSAEEERMINANKYEVRASLLYFGHDDPEISVYTMIFDSRTDLWLIDEVN